MAALALSACTKNSAAVKDEAAVQLEGSSCSFLRGGKTEEGAEAAYSTISCNYDWVAYPSHDWILVNPSSGKAGDNIKVEIKVKENRGLLREGVVNFFDADMLSKRTLNVAQEEGRISVESTEIDAEWNDTSAKIKVTSNASWKAESLTAGFTVDGTPVVGDGEITVNFSVNEPEEPKIGKIKITADLDIEGKEIIVTINQKGHIFYVELPKQKDTIDFSVKTYEIEVVSNTEWTAKALTEGITVSPASGSGEGTVTVTVTDINNANTYKDFEVEILAVAQITKRGGTFTLSHGPRPWMPFGTLWGSDFFKAVTATPTADREALPCTVGNITFTVWPSYSVSNTQMRGNMDFYFISGVTGKAKMVVYAFRNSTSTSKYIEFYVAGESSYRSRVQTTKTATRIESSLGEVKAGDMIRIRTSGSGNTFIEADKNGNGFSFEKDE